ncbi:hypothetical protein CF327_g96 [Tilletia walkeri]|nr:hypothetical protein CF327_g96 [Tilletia walkeri]
MALAMATSDIRMLQQQLSHLLEVLETTSTEALKSGSPSSIAALGLTVAQIRQSGVLSRLSSTAIAGGSDSAASTLQKLVVRSTSLIGTNFARADGPSSQLRGYLIAYEIADQTEFEIWESSAAAWAQSAVNLCGSATLQTPAVLLRAATQLLDAHILGGPAGQRLDYSRQVVLPNAPKFGAGLTRLAEMHIGAESHERNDALLVDLFVCLTAQVHRLPNIYRPYTSRMHEITVKVLLEDIASNTPTFTALHAAAARLLIALHLTGASNASAARRSGSANAPKSTQAQLWNATVGSVLRTMNDAASACTSTFNRIDKNALQQGGDRLSLNIPAEDEHALHAGLVSTFVRLNGILHVMLSYPTLAPVPIPATAILAGASELLSLSPQTRMKPGSDGSLHSLQQADLATLQMASMSLVAVTMSACQEGAQPYSASVLATLTNFVQRKITDSNLRRHAFRTISVLLGVGSIRHGSNAVPTSRLSIDPAGRVLTRLAQACLAEVSRLFTSAPPRATQQANGDADGSSRKVKRQRVFESSDLLGQGTQGGPFGGKTAEDFESAAAAVNIFKSIYAHLSSNLRPAHADLSQTGVLLLIALSELLLNGNGMGGSSVSAEAALEHARILLATTTMTVLSQVLSMASGRLLSLAASRTWTVLQMGRRSPSTSIRAAALEGLSVLDQIVHPRIPSLLPLRLASEEDIGNEAAQWGDEERKIGQAEMDDVRGVSEREAMKMVLDVVPALATEQLDSARNATTEPVASKQSSHNLTASDSHHAMLHHHHSHGQGGQFTAGRASPDPVKPLHRPSTPRIGSPSPVRKAFPDRAEEQRAPETPSKRAREVMVADVEAVSAGDQVEDVEDEGEGMRLGTQSTAVPLQGQSAQKGLQQAMPLGGADDSDEDEDMPQIDMGSDEEGEN